MADLLAPLPLMRAYGGMEIRLEAIDATTGAAVSGVTVSDVAIYGRSLDESGDELPLYTAFLSPQDA